MGRLRPLTYADLYEVANLLERAFGPNLDREARAVLEQYRRLYTPWSRWPWVGRTIRELNLIGWVWEEEGHIVGNASIYLGSKAWVLVNVAVAPEYRRRGIAHQLVAQALDFARRRGRGLWLEMERGNEPARRLYTKLGFQRVTTRVLWTLQGEALHPPLLTLKPATPPPPHRLRARLRRLYPAYLDWRFPFGDLNLLLPGLRSRIRRWWQGLRLIQRTTPDLALLVLHKTPGMRHWVFPVPNPESREPVWDILGGLMATVVLPGARYYLDLPHGLWHSPLQNMGFVVQRQLEVWVWTPEQQAP